MAFAILLENQRENMERACYKRISAQTTLHLKILSAILITQQQRGQCGKYSSPLIKPTVEQVATFPSHPIYWVESEKERPE